MNRRAQQVLKRLRMARTLAGESLPDNMVLPSYDGYGLANVSPTILSHFGIPAVSTPVLAPEMLGEGLKGVQKVVVLLIDALGYLALQDQMRQDRSLGFHALARMGQFGPLTSIFPSTTAACLSTLHTGLAPVGHGISGYRMYFPDRGFIANMIGLSPETDIRRNQLLPRKGDAATLLGVPTVHRLLKKRGVASYCLIDKNIYQSGLSDMLYGGAEVVPFVSASDLFVQIRKMLSEDVSRPTVIWAYWGLLDTILHHYGTRQEEAIAEVRLLGSVLKRELLDERKKGAGKKAGMIVLSDHGHIQVHMSDVIHLGRLTQMRGFQVLPPTGTSRSPYFYLQAGKLEAGRKYYRKAFGNRALILGQEALLSSGLWGSGPVRREFRGLLPEQSSSCILFYKYADAWCSRNNSRVCPWHSHNTVS